MSSALVIFAREPLPGKVKTRLAKGTDDETAAAIYAALLGHTIETARTTGVEVVISLAEKPTSSWATGLEVPLEVQSGGDIGTRMAACFDRRFSEGRQQVVIIGSDNAHILPAHVLAAFTALEEDPVVLGPAEDGGYWMVGQRSPGIDLFTGVPWSSPKTLEVTRERLNTLDARWKELEILPDIDNAEDLRRAIKDPRVPEQLRVRLSSALNNSDQ